ncbi:unnamed protein product, partial [Polarella glacialis]
SRLLHAAALLSAALSEEIQIHGGKYTWGFKENISTPIGPGYTALPKELPGKLVITSFEATPFVGKNGVYMVDVGSQTGTAKELPGSGSINWPNSVTGVTADVFGFPAVVVGNGFLVPSHTLGAIYVMEASPNPEHLKAPVKITKDMAEKLPDSGWFYHEAQFVDVDGDGLLDVLTARCQFGVWPWSKKRGELVWLKQPASAALSGEPWQETQLAAGPDFLFCVQPNTKHLALVAPEFVGERIVYWYMQEDGSMASRVLDAASGPGFSCSWEDLNGDGRLELLATNHASANGSVYAYSFDGEDVATAEVTRHVLATGFTPAKVAAGQGSPGDAVAFRPEVAASEKPHIFLSGDNSNSIFLLVPESEDSDIWSYKTQKIADLNADIGRPSIGDVDGNGFADVFVPAFDAKVVKHYEFAKASSTMQVIV